MKYFILVLFFSLQVFSSLTKPIIDDAHLISYENKKIIESELLKLKEEKDIWLVVWTIPTLNGNSIEELAVKQFNKWNIGDEKKDNGLLLLISLNEKKMRIEVGYGLEGVFPDIIVKKYLDEIIKPSLRENNLSSGVLKLISEISNSSDRQNNNNENQNKYQKTNDVLENELELIELFDANRKVFVHSFFTIMFMFITLFVPLGLKRNIKIINQLSIEETEKIKLNIKHQKYLIIVQFIFPIINLIFLILFIILSSMEVAFLSIPFGLTSTILSYLFLDKACENMLKLTLNESDRALVLKSIKQSKASYRSSTSSFQTSHSSSRDSNFSGGGSSGGGGASSDW